MSRVDGDVEGGEEGEVQFSIVTWDKRGGGEREDREQRRCLVWAGQRLLSWERQAIGELQLCRRDRPAVATAALCAAHLRVLAFPSLPCSLHIRPPAGGSAWRAGSVDIWVLMAAEGPSLEQDTRQ